LTADTINKSTISRDSKVSAATQNLFARRCDNPHPTLATNGYIKISTRERNIPYTQIND
jgi:hypothetical protein